MSLRLLVDEDTLAKALVSRLRQAGHDVLTVHEAGLTAEPEDRVLEHARRENASFPPDRYLCFPRQ